MKKNGHRLAVYQAKNGSLELRLDAAEHTIWATQAEMAAVFDVTPASINRHLSNIFRDKELTKRGTCSKIEQVRIEGGRRVRRKVDAYNLDAIISVGYRISSTSGTKFRQWATRTLRAHLIDGYTINARRIGGACPFGRSFPSAGRDAAFAGSGGIEMMVWGEAVAVRF